MNYWNILILLINNNNLNIWIVDDFDYLPSTLTFSSSFDYPSICKRKGSHFLSLSIEYGLRFLNLPVFGFYQTCPCAPTSGRTTFTGWHSQCAPATWWFSWSLSTSSTSSSSRRTQLLLLLTSTLEQSLVTRVPQEKDSLQSHWRIIWIEIQNQTDNTDKNQNPSVLKESKKRELIRRDETNPHIFYRLSAISQAFPARRLSPCSCNFTEKIRQKSSNM